MKGTNGFVQGIGNALFGLVIALLDGLVFRVTFSWLFGVHMQMGLYGMILGYALATYSTALPSLFYFLFVPWYRRKTVV
jgi:Na+-driven multidrug efflux pump